MNQRTEFRQSRRQFCGKLKREAYSFDFLIGMLHILACATRTEGQQYLHGHHCTSARQPLHSQRILLTLLLLGISISNVTIAQSLPFPLPVLHTGWGRIYIKDVGSFDLPTTMEVQSGKYKVFVDDMKDIMGFDASPLTAQQKGLNEFGQEGFEKYARVMVETTLGSAGDFEKLNFNTSEYSQADLIELGSVYKQQTQQSFLGTGLKLIEWYPLKMEKVNGMSCIHLSYRRQLQENPLVLVHIYIFHNNDRMHTFTLSYRISETDYWKSDYAAILKSFRITNIR